MKLKGLDKFREKIPMFSGKKMILFPLYLISVFIISLIIHLYFDLLPTLVPSEGIMDYISVLFPILGVLLMGLIAIFLVYQMWYHRDRLKVKYGQLSYQKVFLSGFGGIVVIFTIVTHEFIPFYLWNYSFWSQFPFRIFITPLTSFITPLSLVLGYIRLFLGIFVCFLGVAMILRALITFGIDYMAVVYLYFPEESSLQEHKIYSILRHPTYSGALFLCLGGMLIQFTLYSFVFYLILHGGIYIHIHFVEEKELINRFGDSYKEYRERTPAFYACPKNWGKFFKYLLGIS